MPCVVFWLNMQEVILPVKHLSSSQREKTLSRSSPRQVRCRQITASDRDGVVNLLTKGFDRSREYWQNALGRLSDRAPPPNMPKYGYLLEDNGVPVGVLLLIYTSLIIDGVTKTRCNVSSWYVEPAFRMYAALLASQATPYKDVTYFNITPAPPTWPLLEAQGYKRFCNGIFMSVPLLNRSPPTAEVQTVTPDIAPGKDLQPFEVELLLAHGQYGCLSVTCQSESGRHPFVFGSYLKYRIVPNAYLVYCRSVDDFIKFAGPLGRFLAQRGYSFVALDANGPVPGLIGKYRDNRPKYFKGPEQPRLGDMAYCEQGMFGF